MHPLCDSVVVHVMISAMYGLISKVLRPLEQRGMAQEKLDTLIAMGENLIQIKSSNDMQRLEGLFKSLNW